MQLVQDLREDVRVGRDPRAEDSQERVRALRRLRAALPRSAEVPALDHPQTQRQQVRLDARLTVVRIADCGIRSPQSATRNPHYGAFVGGASSTNLSFNPDDTSTSFVADTITPSTCGSRSI